MNPCLGDHFTIDCAMDGHLRTTSVVHVAKRDDDVVLSIERERCTCHQSAAAALKIA